MSGALGRRLAGKLLLSGGLALLAPPFRAGAFAADADKGAPAVHAPFRILMILFRGETEVEKGFRDYLRDHHVPVDITVRNLHEDLSGLPAVIAEAKADRPDLVYTWGTGITLGVLGEYDRVDPKVNITDLPVLFTMVTSPTGSRLIPSPGDSSRNFTGVSHVAPLQTQLRAMQAYRHITRLAVIYNPTEPNSALAVRDLLRLCESEDIALIAEPVPLDSAGRPRADTLPALVDKIAIREPQFLYIGPDTFIGDNRDVITAEAIRDNLPVFTGTELEIRTSNAMAGLVTSYYDVGIFAAYKAEQILVDHTPPGEIPIETLRRFKYIIKMGVARQLGLYPPIGLIGYAEIIP
ncbi:MAG TPA: ABC transporter substrate-binding protein [Acetobacteraceae bacterium]|nr:ABC transporter substrate-binding protein [Acetobacteraceae bacterium]